MLCPCEHNANVLALDSPSAVNENWAPFTACRSRVGEKSVFVLITGESVNAAKAGALQLLTTCPGAPILYLDECLPYTDNETFLVERAIRVDVHEYDLLHANPTPVDEAPASMPGSALLEAAADASGLKRRVVASCDFEVTLETQHDWLRRHYQVDALDNGTQDVGRLIDEHGGRWLAVMTVAFDTTEVRPVIEAMCNAEARQ